MLISLFTVFCLCEGVWQTFPAFSVTLNFIVQVQMEYNRREMLGYNVKIEIKKITFYETNPVRFYHNLYVFRTTIDMID